MPTPNDVAIFLQGRIAERLRIAPAEVDPQATFDRFDFSSLAAVELAVELEEWLAMPVSPLVFYEHPTIAQLAEHLATDEARKVG